MILTNQICLHVSPGINTEAIWVFSILLVVAPFNLGQSIEAVPTIKNWCSVQPSSPSSAKGSFSNIKQPLSTYRVYVNLSLSASVGNSTIFVKLGMDPTINRDRRGQSVIQHFNFIMLTINTGRLDRDVPLNLQKAP
jgi:hypothetical protein